MNFRLVCMGCDHFRYVHQRMVVCVLILVMACGFSASSSAVEPIVGQLGQGEAWETPYYIIDSDVDGPIVAVTGGIHGNEPSGARAAEQIRHWPIERGKLIVVPRVNTAALELNQRRIPHAPKGQEDLNRNFPSAREDQPRGAIATALWELLALQRPDWIFDLHEGYEFNISHQPKPGKDKSVGSSIIFDQTQTVGPLVEQMLAAVNSTVTDQDRRFVLRGRGPKKTTLASAAIHALGAKGMTLETTFQFQRLPVRTRQHRTMMNVALNHIGMITSDYVDVLTPSRETRDRHLCVALYDDEGGSSRGVTNLTHVFDTADDMTVVHLGAAEMRSEILAQFDVVVFGGGSGSKEAAAIGAVGAEAVQRFVQEGGGYVGVCAGAFLCSSHYPWSLNLIDTHVFTGSQHVEGLGPKQMWYRGPASSQTIELTNEGQVFFPDIPQTVSVRYQNGPIVSPRLFPGLKPYRVLAWFRSEIVRYPPQKDTMRDTPAIVYGRYGKGRVMSISPHPEGTEGLESMLAEAVRSVVRTNP